MTYMECPECGQRALAVATRCPRCGVDFPPQSSRRPVARTGPRGYRPMLAFVGVLVAGVVAIVVAVALRGRAGSKAATPAPVAAPVPRAAPLAAESVPRQPVLQRDGPSQAARTVPAGPAPASGGVRRYARTWVNVRQDRSNGAPAVRVLNPGEAVMVDSLKRGWYRVRANDRTVGYVYRTQLDAAPPAARF